jgi:hypothetical protein
MKTAKTTSPIRSESARRYVNGSNGRWGVVLLYPDQLASVNVRSELWGCFLGPIVFIAAGWPVSVPLGAWHAFVGVLLGTTIGRYADRRTAARKMADGGAGATVIPLASIDSLRTDRSTRVGGLYAVETMVVTTADGTEYGFRGRIGSLPDEIAGAMASDGREVRATPLGLAVTPQAVGNGA